MNRFLKSILLSLYIIAAACFFLYLQFPSDTITKYLSSYAESLYPGIQISMTGIQPALPIGLSVSSGAVSFQDVPLVRADTMHIRPKILSILSPKIQIHIQGVAHGGRFNGVIEFSKDHRPLQYQVNAGLTGVEMGELLLLKNLTNQRLSGTCDGRIEYSVDGGRSAVSAQMKAINCKYKLATPVANIESLSFQMVHANLTLDRKGLEIRDAVFKGRQIDGKIIGRIVLKQPVEKSVLKLSGELKPHPGFLTELANDTQTQLLSNRSKGRANIMFKIEGTFGKPIFSF